MFAPEMPRSGGQTTEAGAACRGGPRREPPRALVAAFALIAAALARRARMPELARPIAAPRRLRILVGVTHPGAATARHARQPVRSTLRTPHFDDVLILQR